MQSLSPNAEVLIVAPHIEPPLREFRKLWGKIASASMLQTGLQLGRQAWADREIAVPNGSTPSSPCFGWRPASGDTTWSSPIHRNGYWLGLLRGLVGQSARSKWVWVRRATGHRDDPAPYAEVADPMAFARWGGGMGVSY